MGLWWSLTASIDSLHCSTLFQALKNMLWVSLSRHHQMQLMLRLVKFYLSCLPVSCGCCLSYEMLCLFSERKGVHWKTQHDIGTGEVYTGLEKRSKCHMTHKCVYI